MLNRASRASEANGLGKFQHIVDAMRPTALPTVSVERTVPRRRPGYRSAEVAKGVLGLAMILVVTCAYLLLLDRLGIPPAALTDFPLVD